MVVVRPGTVVQRPTNVSWEGGTVASVMLMVLGMLLLEMLHVKEISSAAMRTVSCSTIMQHLTTPAAQVLQLLIISTEQRQHRQHGDENIRE